MMRGGYLYPGLHQVEPERQRLPHEHIWIVALVERLLQLLQLPAGEVGPGPSPFTPGAVLIRVSRICVCVCVGEGEHLVSVTRHLISKNTTFESL